MNEYYTGAEETKLKVIDILCNINKSFSSKQNDVIKLTEREKEYIILSSLGLLNREIASVLKVTITTVKKTLSKITSKLNVRNKAQCITLLCLNNNNSNAITKEKIGEVSAKYIEYLKRNEG